jgi:hypothetical protein
MRPALPWAAIGAAMAGSAAAVIGTMTATAVSSDADRNRLENRTSAPRCI